MQSVSWTNILASFNWILCLLYWFPSCPFCSPLPKLFLYCINQYMSFLCLNSLLVYTFSLGINSFTWQVKPFMVCVLTTHPSSSTSWHTLLSFPLHTIYYSNFYSFLVYCYMLCLFAFINMTLSTEEEVCVVFKNKLSLSLINNLGPF